MLNLTKELFNIIIIPNRTSKLNTKQEMNLMTIWTYRIRKRGKSNGNGYIAKDRN